MHWEMCIVVSIYRRQFWLSGLVGGEGPDREKVFREPLANGNDDEVLRATMKRLCERCEEWLNKQGVKLVTHLVVTVYSLELITRDSYSRN